MKNKYKFLNFYEIIKFEDIFLRLVNPFELHIQVNHF